jgi:hypothetical protein
MMIASYAAVGGSVLRVFKTVHQLDAIPSVTLFKEDLMEWENRIQKFWEMFH